MLAPADRAVRAGAWSAVDIFARQGVQFVVTVTLARLLAPEVFGLIALLAVFTGLASVIVEGGPNIALIRHHASTPVQESSVFWFNIAAALLIGAILLAIAPLVAAFYGFALLKPLMAVAAAQVLVTAAGSVPSALLVRSLQFRTMLYVGATASILAGIVGIALAAAGYGVWALSLQAFTAALTTSSMLWIVSGWRPRLAFDPASARPLFRFGSHLVITGFLDVLYMQGFALILGKLHGVRDLGLYNRAQSTQMLPSSILSQVIGRITLPMFAARADDPEALRRAVRRAVRMAMVVNIPIMIGVGVLADLVIRLLFGPAWIESAPILTILCVAGLLYPPALINLQALLAQDRSHYYLWLTVAKQSVGVVAVLVGSFFGVLGLAYSLVAYCVIGFFINARSSQIFLGYGAWAQLRDLAPLFALGAAMGGAVHLARPLLGFGPVLDFAILAALGAAVYVGAALLLRIEAIDDAARLGLQLVPARLRDRLSRTPPARPGRRR